jgi:nucleoside-diphosphate-sugar epimerase
MSVPNRTRLLLTGASGFIGRHLSPLLLADGYEVHVVARTVPSDSAGMHWHQADLLEPGTARSLAKSVAATHLVHLAWNVTPGAFWNHPDNLDWVAASLELYRGFAEAGGQRALIAGTCAEYDWRHDPLDEATTPCEPATLYGTAKHALHLLLRAAAARDNVSLAWARLFFLYGPGEPRQRLLPDVITSISRGQPALCGDGRAERDFMYVTDAALALRAILNSSVSGPVNVASGTCLPLREVIETAASCLGRPDLVRLGARPTPLGEPTRLAASVALLRDSVGFTPRTNLYDGIMASIAWWREQLERDTMA